MSGRQLHLNVNLLHSGVYPSAWRLPESRPDAFLDIDHFVRVARIAERASSTRSSSPTRPPLTTDRRPPV